MLLCHVDMIHHINYVVNAFFKFKNGSNSWSNNDQKNPVMLKYGHTGSLAGYFLARILISS